MLRWACWVILAWSSIVQFVVPLRLHRETHPSFYISETALTCDPEHTWRDTIHAVENHPWRLYDEKLATFSLWCLPWNETNFLALPRKSFPKFYLFWGLQITEHYPMWSPAMRARTDFIFTSLDLREHMKNNTAVPLPGVTFPAASRIIQYYDPEIPPKYFMTFRGSLHSNVRRKVVQSFHKYKKEGVVVEAGSNMFPASRKRYKELLNSAYVLVPVGHGRWSYRLSEVVESCAIPVIMADGLTLPYEELIDWSSIAILLKEDVIDQAVALGPQNTIEEWFENRFVNMLMNPEKLLSLLPRDSDVIQATRKRVCDISTKYFGSKRNRFESLLKAAALHVGIPGSSVYASANYTYNSSKNNCSKVEAQKAKVKIRGVQN